MSGREKRNRPTSSRPDGRRLPPSPRIASTLLSRLKAGRQRTETRCPPLPRGADRNLSPRKVSQKREYLGIWPETFGKFSLRLRQFGVWRPSEKRDKAPILQAFRDYGVIYLRLTDWLAGAAGFEPLDGD